MENIAGEQDQSRGSGHWPDIRLRLKNCKATLTGQDGIEDAGSLFRLVLLLLAFCILLCG
jgi:hypothetical protein